MKIIKEGTKLRQTLEAECKNCGTVVSEEIQNLKFEHDRDGDFARERCPNAACNKEIFFYKNQK